MLHLTITCMHYNTVNTQYSIVPLSLCTLSLAILAVVDATGTVADVTLVVIAGVTSLVALGVVSDTVTMADITAAFTLDCSTDTTELLVVVI